MTHIVCALIEHGRIGVVLSSKIYKVRLRITQSHSHWLFARAHTLPRRSRLSMVRLLSAGARRSSLVAVCAAAHVLLTALGERPDLSDDEAAVHSVLARQHDELRRLLEQHGGGGRGLSLRKQLTTVRLPKHRLYAILVELPDLFQEECGSTPLEFHGLLDDVRDVMLLARDVDGAYTPAENATRRGHAFKYSPAERLFALSSSTCAPSSRAAPHGQLNFGIAHTAVHHCIPGPPSIRKSAGAGLAC